MNRLRRQQIVTELSRLGSAEFDSLLGEVSTARSTEQLGVDALEAALNRSQTPLAVLLAHGNDDGEE
jgi:hypothetical protein